MNQDAAAGAAGTTSPTAGTGGSVGATGGSAAGAGGSVAGAGGSAAGAGGSTAGAGGTTSPADGGDAAPQSDGPDGGLGDGGLGDGAADGPVAPPPGFTQPQWNTVLTLSPLPPLPADPTNRVADDARAAALGQQLFFEKSYSGALTVAGDATNGGVGAAGDKGKLSCASCHAGPALVDTRSKPGNVSLGADFLPRNSLSLVNAAHYKWVNWAGRFSAQWELPLGVAENAKNMNSNRLRIAHVIFDKYRTEYEAIFGAMEPAIGSSTARFPADGKPKAAGAPDGPWEGMTDDDRAIVNAIFVNFGKVLEAYLRKLESRDTRLDRFVTGDFGALTSQEQDGLKLFIGKAKCVSCHAGPFFTDDAFHALAVPQTGPHVPATDLGRFADVPPLLASPFSTATPASDDRTTGRLVGLTNPPPDSAKGQFRTPTLRGVNLTPPYMHAGQLATLADVVDFYDAGGGAAITGVTKDAQLAPLGLTADEKAQLVAFLSTLQGAALPAALLTDTSKP